VRNEAQTSPEPSLSLLPEVEARAILSDRRLSFRLLRPPYAALGRGELRVLRVVEGELRTEIVAGYEGYERIDVRDRAVSER
jgi:hypothetical protein